MKKTTLILATAIVLALPLAARARIGETVAQCAARYGEPVGGRTAWDKMTTVPTGTYQLGCYAKGGFSILVTFERGVAVELDIWKAESSSIELTADEQKMFLDANSAGQVWSQPKKVQVRGQTYTQRTRPDGVIVFADFGFRIVTRSYDNAHEKYLDSLPDKDAGPTKGF